MPDEDDDEEDEMWGIWGGWYGANVSPPPPLPPHIRNMYIQECPICHAIHETVTEMDRWCEEHANLKAVWSRRKEPVKADRGITWECQGCEQCEDRVVVA